MKIKLNRKAVSELARGADMQNKVLRPEAAKIMARAGEGHELEIRAGRARARATVRTVSDSAKANPDNLRRAVGR